MNGMIVIDYFMVMCMVAIGCAGQPLNGGCFMNCVQSFSNRANKLLPPSTTSFRPFGAQPVQVAGNLTVTCPAQMNQSELANFPTVCDYANELFKCSHSCPDDIGKRAYTAILKPLKFMCLERFEDVKKHLPCLSETCPDVQRACSPKCGSLDDLSMKLDAEAKDAFAQAVAASYNGSSPGVVDVNNMGGTASPTATGEMLGILEQLCTAVDCHIGCSKQPTVDKCGEEASVLSEDLLKLVLTSANQSISALSFHQQSALPAQCGALGSTSIAPPAGQQETPSPMRHLAAPVVKCETPTCRASMMVAATPFWVVFLMMVVLVSKVYF